MCACMVSRPAKLCAHTFNASLHCLPRPLPRLSPLPQSLPIRTTSFLAYEHSVGFASLRNFGRSISGILARPLPKGAGLRQGSHLSNTSILCDTYNVQIVHTLSAVKTEGSSPPTFSFQPSPPKHRTLPDFP